MNSDIHQTAALDYDSYRGRRFIANLDGLRAISILLVMIHHTTHFNIPALENFQDNARLGVSVFFVISGYLICTLFLRERDQFGDVSLKAFFLRRIYRLLPLYYVVLLLECVLVFVLNVYSPENRELFARKLPGYLFYYSNWLTTATQGPFFVSWSLAIEEQFYLAFGLMFAFLSRRWIISILVALYALKFTLLNLTSLPQLHPELPWSGLSTIQSSLLFGVLAAYALHSRRGYDFFRRLFTRPATPWILLGLMLGWLAAVKVCADTNVSALPFNILAAFLVISLAMRNPVPAIGGNAMSHVGKVSYGIYLLHLPVFYAVKRLTDQPLAVLIIGFAGVMVVASLSYRYLESPFLRLKEKLHRG